MPEIEIIILRLTVAVIIGGLIGLERDYKNKSAGFRTMILICLGSCLFTMVSIFLSNGTTDRIASNIVTGIGFLGAGVIFHNENKVNGLTTAATVWVTAALGMCTAAGFYTIAATGCAIVMATLLLLPLFEKWMEKTNQVQVYKITGPFRKDFTDNFEKLMKSNNLEYKIVRQTRAKNMFTAEWTVKGKEAFHQKFIDLVLEDPEVQEFTF